MKGQMLVRTRLFNIPHFASLRNKKGVSPNVWGDSPNVSISIIVGIVISFVVIQLTFSGVRR